MKLKRYQSGFLVLLLYAPFLRDQHCCSINMTDYFFISSCCVVLCSLKERMRRSGGLPGCSREPDELHSHFSMLGEKVFPGLVKEEMGDFSIEQSSLLMYRLRHQ